MNLVVLEGSRQGKPGGVLVFDQSESQFRSNKTTQARQNKESSDKAQLVSKASKELQTHNVPRVPDIFMKNAIPRPSSFPALASNQLDPCTHITIDRWIFGQYNRILPTKASCRALTNLLANVPGGVPLNKATLIASEAAVLAKCLKYYDKRLDYKRDDAYATAFPSIGDNASKSQLRYANHFVVDINTRGQLSGLLYDLKLIDLAKEGQEAQSEVLLTEVGWDYAMLPNPILDGNSIPQQKFYDDEVSMLLDHILRRVPIEAFAYTVIIMLVTQGAKTPDLLDQGLIGYHPDKRDQRFSKSFLSTQRSGAVSRMVDLGLLRRVRSGVRLSYETTDRGNAFFEQSRSGTRGNIVESTG